MPDNSEVMELIEQADREFAESIETANVKTIEEMHRVIAAQREVALRKFGAKLTKLLALQTH